MVGYKDLSLWVDALGKKHEVDSGVENAKENMKYPVELVIRKALVCVNPEQLDQALNTWNAHYAQIDESLAIDGKTMCSAINEKGLQTHIMSAIGHQSGRCYTQKKSAH